MTYRPVLYAAIMLGLLVPGASAVARPAQRAAPAPPDRTPTRAFATAHTVRPVAGGSPAMVTHTGSARQSASVRSATGNGIAGVDLARPATRGTAGGGNLPSGGIDGGTVHRRH